MLPQELTGSVTWVVFDRDGGQPMGLENYESALTFALHDRADSGYRFSTCAITSLRGRTRDARRVPLGILETASLPLAGVLGRVAYRGAGNVHRFDLRLPPAPGPEVVTIHDVAPLRFPDEGRLPAWSVRAARRARRAICPSAFAAEEVSAMIGISEIDVVPNGVDAAFRDPTPLSAEERRRFGLPHEFVLTAGGSTRRKNLPMLAEAWRLACARLDPALGLVVTGPPSPQRTAALSGVPRLTCTGYVPSDVMPRIVASAVAVVVPSTYEGFGLPALEAMTAGVPVIAVRAGALAEVCGDAAVLVPASVEGLCSAIVDVCRDAELRRDRAAAGRRRAGDFSWERSAAGHLAAYDRAFGTVRRAN